MTAPALQTDALSVAFGAYVAVDNVSLSFERGRRYALIGPNGAGKTTLLNAISGRQVPSAGSVRLAVDGVLKDITTLPASRRAQAGLGRSFQIVNIFPDLTVRGNLVVAAQAARYGAHQPWWRARDRDPLLRQRADEVLAEIGLQGQASTSASSLSHGDQRMLELGLSIVADPAVLLLDEPLAGIGQERIADTVDLMLRISQDRTVVLVEHNMDAVMRFSDEIVVLAAGAVICRGTPQQVRMDPRVRTAYLGSHDGAH